MSQTFSLICRETNKRLWVGQGWGAMESFYTAPEHRDRVTRFLNEHVGKTLQFVCDDTSEEVHDMQEFD